MGQRLLSAKGDKPFWSGVSRLSVNDRGQRRFTTLDNCYVSQDGSELRAFPGYATIIDLSDTNNSAGFGRYVPDAVRPVLQYSSPNEPYRFQQTYDSSVSQSLIARAKVSSLFGFEQIGNEVFLIGESRFREQPSLSAPAGAQNTVVELTSANGADWVVTVSGFATSNTTTDDAFIGLNGLKTGDVIYLENLVVTSGNTADQAIVDAELEGKMHEITVWSGTADISISTHGVTEPSVGWGSALTVTGEIHRVRGNRNDDYGTAGIEPYAADYDDRPDDPDALTCWRVSDDLDLTSTTYKGGTVPCYPSWVANRQRDFGDANHGEDPEGIILSGTFPYERGCSRREQRRLPFRPNIEPALDRIILAVPQYGCMFQIPAKVPFDASNWKSGTATSRGIAYQNNSVYDRPRSLGIPKPRLIESTATPGMASPGDWGNANQYSASITAYGSPDLGLTAGDYKVAISFEDPGTGDEGLASEPMTVTIPSSTQYAYTIRINYIHPGYSFPECLALKMNVYLSVAGGEALAFYGQFELAENPARDGIIANPEDDISGWFGTHPCTPTDPRAIYRSFEIPMLGDTGDISDALDTTRLAPQSATMPRGADACKFVRGVLFSGGAMGNAGPNNQLWHAKASGYYQSNTDFWGEDELNIRAHSIEDAAMPGSGSTDGDSQGSTLGIAGRAFPDAYQGIPFIASDIFPDNDALRQVDRVLNRKVTSLVGIESPSTFNYHWHVERLRLERDVFDRTRRAGTSPSDLWASNTTDKDIFYVMPRGQLQVGDPGAPNRSSRAFIKIVDPSKGDDITAIGQLNGSVIGCTRKETYTYSWYRNPGSEEPNLLTNEFGCVASNSMVEFDGGLAWLSERGPVALGAGLQHVGADVAEDFYGQSTRYARDSQGMMRHSWGVHDAARGLVMWGLLRSDADHTIEYEGETIALADATDEQLSRFPCDEVLIWSYRASAFSHWRPPAGLEVLWMRPLRDSKGVVRTCFLASDNRIYAFDDAWSDTNAVFNDGLGGTSELEVTVSDAGSATTTLSFTGKATFQDGDTGYTAQRNSALVLRAGMLVEFLDSEGNMTADTTISSVTTTSESGTSTIELAAAQTWAKGTVVRIGGRQRMKIISTFFGAETADTQTIDKVQMRYTADGSGYANARVKAYSNERGHVDGEEAQEVTFTKQGVWEPLGRPKSGTTIPAALESLGRRTSFSQGRVSGPEIALQVEITGETQVRIQDLALEVG